MSEEREKPVLDVHEKPSPGLWLTLSFQHLFAMFGATILVPILIGLDPSVALLTSGLGTLAYIFITKGKIPIYLGSSFAFIVPFTMLADQGIEAQMMGCFIVGVIYALFALLVKFVGMDKIMRIFPPVVTGPIVIGIGLSLAGDAVGMSTIGPDGEYSIEYLVIALFTLFVAIIFTNYIKGFLGLIPILIGIVSGCALATVMGVMDFTAVREAEWFAVPNVSIPFVDYSPEFSWAIVSAVIFVVIVPISEHIGNVTLLGKVAGKNFIKDPGLDRSLFGDSVAIMISSLFGGVPNTTYGENIGVMALTRVYSVYVIAGAAVLAIVFSFCGKISALIMSIPEPVMGGVSLLLFGVIASGGLRMLIDNKVNLSINRNLIIVSTMLVISVGNLEIKTSASAEPIIYGVGLAAVAGIILHQILPNKEAGFGELQKEDAA